MEEPRRHLPEWPWNAPRIARCGVAALLLVHAASAAAIGATFPPRPHPCEVDPRVGLGLVSFDVCAGAQLFFRETFAGNGRTCATCHPAANNFTVDPLSIAALPELDPLFVGERDPRLAELERPALMRLFGLVLENVDGFSDPTRRFVLRSVPHVLGLATSLAAQEVPTDGTTVPPLERTGWSGDGAPGAGTLRDFATGAVVQHFPRTLRREAGKDFVLPTEAELDALAAFQRAIGRTNELALDAVSLTDERAELGRVTFLDPAARCNGCHANAGANVANGVNRNFDTGVERVRVTQLDILGLPLDGGFGGAALGAPDFDADGDGVPDSFGNGTFNTPPLVEAADTGPFFHSNAFTTVEQATEFFNSAAFNESPAGAGAPISLTNAQVAAIGRFLRVINASLNDQMAGARVRASIAIADAYGWEFPEVQRGLIQLAIDEGLAAIDLADASLGTGMAFSIGQGTLMF